MTPPRSLFVIGIHRSGTSCVAGILDRLGVWMGAEEWEPQEFNPKGNIEDPAFRDAFQRALGNWRLPYRQNPQAEGVQKLVDLVRLRDQTFDVWGVKSPYLCCLLMPLLQAAAQPMLIGTQRNLDEVTASLVNREEDMPERVAADIVSDYWRMKKVKTITATNRLDVPMLSVPYESVLENPAGLVQKIAAFAFWEHPYEPTDEQIEDAIEFVDPELRHYG